jgi:hypothetical protein
MLQLGTGMQTVEGVTVFPDHADPKQYWYLPGPVALSRRSDGRANFSYIKFKPAAVQGGVKGGGFLAFGVCLKLAEGVEAKIRSKLALASDAKLTAVPFDEGRVRVVALDLEGGGGTIAAAPADGAAASFRAVEAILGATVPSLFGDNDAIFSLVLSQEGAIILEQALEQGATPIGVIYELKFTALQPALDVSISIDFSRVYKHFSVGLGANVYFVKAEIEAGMEQLRQSGAISIKITNFTTDGSQAEREKWAMDFLMNHLLNDWFEPTLTPGQLQGGGAGIIPATPSTKPATGTQTGLPSGQAAGGRPAGAPPLAGGGTAGGAPPLVGGTPAPPPVATPPKEK